SKRAVGLDFSPRADFLAHRLEDHKTGGGRLAVLVSNFAADRKKSLAAAPADTEQNEKDRGYSVPRAPSVCARDHADTEHHPSPGFGKTTGIKSLVWVGRRCAGPIVPESRHSWMLRQTARCHRRRRAERSPDGRCRIAGCNPPSWSAPEDARHWQRAASDRGDPRCRGRCHLDFPVQKTLAARVFRRSRGYCWCRP